MSATAQAPAAASQPSQPDQLQATTAPDSSSQPAQVGPRHARQVLRRKLIGTDRPSHLRALQVWVATLCLIVGALTSAQMVTHWRSIQGSVDQSNQLARVSAIKADLLHADALATNAFLVAGLEPATQRAAYDEAMSSVTRLIADAADAEPADRTVLEQLNVTVLRYATTMEAARANNRQGFPVGSAYLSKASGDLRATAIPLTDALITANSARASASLGTLSGLPLLICGVLALIALFVANRWIALRFKRRVNVGVAGAALITALVTLAGLALQWQQSSENANVNATTFALVRDGSSALGLANDAKANESLGLVARGSGDAYETTWQTASREVSRLLRSDAFRETGVSGALATQWSAYVAKHDEIVDTDNAGQWEQAVAAATSPAAGSASASYAAFDESLRATVADAAAQTDSRLAGGSSLFVVLAWVAALVSILAAGLGWRGIGQRLAEYQ